MNMLNMMTDGSMCPGCGGFPALDASGGPTFCDDCVEGDMTNKIDWPLNEWLSCCDDVYEAMLFTTDSGIENFPLLGVVRNKLIGETRAGTWRSNGQVHHSCKCADDISLPKKEWAFPSSMYVAVTPDGVWARTESEAHARWHKQNGGAFREYVPVNRVTHEQVLGWAHAHFCIMLDKGEDPRKADVPELIEAFRKDFDYDN